jgi:5,5'-dehydrodivanillate O-demethylase
MDVVVTRVPVDDQHFANFGRAFFHAPKEVLESMRDAGDDSGSVSAGGSVGDIGDAILRGDLHLDAVDDRSRMLEIEDYITQVGQGPIELRPPEHLGRSDAQIVLFRRIWARELAALERGRPLKRWRRPDQPLQATGE